jgi:hypothetical protein
MVLRRSAEITPSRYADQDRDQHRHQCQFDGGRQPREKVIRHGPGGEQAGAEVALKQVTVIVDELDDQRPVEPELVPQCFHLCLVAVSPASKATGSDGIIRDMKNTMAISPRRGQVRTRQAVSLSGDDAHWCLDRAGRLGRSCHREQETASIWRFGSHYS